MTDLKTKIERGEYEVDSRAVAEEIVAKLRLIRRARERLATAGDGAAPRVRGNRFRAEPAPGDRSRARC